MWTSGKSNGFKWEIQHFDEPSRFGIDGGRISKLWIQRISNNEIMANYSRGWDIEPSEEVKALYNDIINRYN